MAVPVTVETTPTSSPGTTESDVSTEEQVLVYGTVIAVVLLACTLVVGVILLLKYIQISRRDTDKGLHNYCTLLSLLNMHT